MKARFLFLFFIMLVQNYGLNAQVLNSQIEGILEVYDPIDPSNMFIGKSITFGNSIITDSNNTVIGNSTGSKLNHWASDNTFLGSRTGRNKISPTGTTLIGSRVSGVYSDGSYNTMVGAFAGYSNYGEGNVYFGYYTGLNNLGGTNSVVIGRSTGTGNSTIDKSVLIGSHAGQTFGDSPDANILLGYEAGSNETGSDKLYIENSNASSQSALVYGEFDNDILQLNATLRIDNPNSGLSSLRMRGTDGDFEEVIRYASFSNDCYLGAIGGPGGPLYLRSNGLTQLAIIENGNVGIGDNAPSEKLEVNGNTLIKEDLISNGNASVSGQLLVNTLPTNGSTDLRLNSSGIISTSSSDLRLKTDVGTFEDALTKVQKLRGVSFRWKHAMDEGTQLGVIAQEVQEVIPEIVTQHGEYLGVDYSEMAAIFIEALNEQQTRIEKQLAEIAKQDVQIDLLSAKLDSIFEKQRP